MRARLAGRGDWDVAVFDAKTRRNVAGSAAFGSSELAEGFVRKGQRLLVQACRYRGGAAGAKLSVSYLGIEGAAKAASAGKVQVVDVATRDRAAKSRLQGLGLDLTEHGDADSVEVVLHDAADEQKLRDAGFSYDVRIADLDARTKASRAADRRFAAEAEQTALPSGRTAYRRLADYELEMKQLAAALPEPRQAGHARGDHARGPAGQRHRDHARRRRHAGRQARCSCSMGVHHAREWPSSEHAMEFGYDLLTNYGKSARTTRLVNATRTIVVPIVNVDGFNLSREAPDDSGCRRSRTSARTAASPTGRRRRRAPAACRSTAASGVDPNRNYGGLWGGQGASFNPINDTYRGAGPFSEPETRNIQKLVSSRQVTNLITNHTYSQPDAAPAGPRRGRARRSTSRCYRALGERMTDHNLYANMPSYGLYDTSGTTEDWSYYSTGGLGLHVRDRPERVPPGLRDRPSSNEYLGRGDAAGAGKGGNREAYYEMLESTADAGMHSLLTGKAPKGSTITLRKQFETKTSPVIGPGGTGAGAGVHRHARVELHGADQRQGRLAREPVDAADRGRQAGPRARRAAARRRSRSPTRPARRRRTRPRTPTRTCRSRSRRRARTASATTTAA